MAKVSNVNTRVYLDEYALSGFISEISMNVEQSVRQRPSAYPGQLYAFALVHWLL